MTCRSRTHCMGCRRSRSNPWSKEDGNLSKGAKLSIGLASMLFELAGANLA